MKLTMLMGLWAGFVDRYLCLVDKVIEVRRGEVENA